MGGRCCGRDTDSLKGFPAPPLGSFAIYESDRIGCATRTSRWQPYATSSTNLSWKIVDFAGVQEKCIGRNRHRYGPDEATALIPIKRTAIVLRAWDGLHWTDDDLRSARAMLTELVLFTGGQYQLFVLLHIREPADALPGPGETVDSVNGRYVPEELVNVTEIWNYTDCQMAYPKVGEYE